MISKIYLRFSVSLVLVFSMIAISLPQVGYAQTAPAQAISGDLQKRLTTIEEKVEARRKELGIPGMSLVIVKDDQIIFIKGFGYKNFEKQIPVTADTQFAIGSASKAFTALSVLMSQDEGKLSLDDNPKKHLPYFKINDAEIDKNITIRDLLSHSSGLNRTDLGWVSGKLNREEIIRVAGEAKPQAKLRERFLYQNVMFAAAGEIVSTVQKQPWERFVEDKIFKPLGMTNSDLSVKAMQKAKDYSYGYSYNTDTKETRNLPIRDIDAIAPAGSINSSARDMALWLRFILNGGAGGGKRLVSEKGFEEWLKPQMKIGGKSSYGLGWFLQDWNGLKVAQHGGNIDGFNSMVAMIPEKKLGFVMLTNVSGSSLGSELMPIVWENILGNPNAANQTASADASKEIGSYRFEEAGFDVEIKMQDGKLVAVVPGQPTYILEKVVERKYKLNGAPDGFFVTFKDTEAFLEQPQGNYTLPKVKADAQIPTTVSDAAKELVGKYASEKNAARTIEITQADGKVSLVVEGQQPYVLNEKSKDLFAMSPLPDDYKVKAKRDASGKIIGITILQPEGEFGFNRIENDAAKSAEKPKISVDELMAKVINALGGEANWRKLNSRQSKIEFDFIHQGVKGYGTGYAKAPNMSAQEATITALGKTIGSFFEYFDGTNGGEEVSFAPTETYSGKQLEDARIGANFYGLLDWKTLYKNAEFKGASKVGDEDAYIVVFEPEKGNKDTIYFSQKTFLPLKLESLSSSSTSSVSQPYSEMYSDYRTVDGVMLPFKTVNSNSGNGDLVLTIKEVKHNVAINDKAFKPKGKK
ncbi:MAG: beta-lactamase family protein [Acidobacteria bacterium]|jgi:CubicO group peptidase (beta-lactamase class C family)|nr:beta-lactamase family protein [Acidobacteriota bacterium]